MDTQPNPRAPSPEPVPGDSGRETPSTLRRLAAGAVVVGLTSTGVLAVILTASTGGGAVDPANAAGPAATAPTTSSSPSQNGSAPFGGQPPQLGQGGGPGHAATGGS
jgi:hypothetical protein